jgi:hypothetical protein
MKAREQPKGPAADASASPKVIPYERAVSEAKELVLKLKDVSVHVQLRLGELADRVETKYKDRTLAHFAKDIKIATCTLARYRDVYRAWKPTNICDPGRKSYPSYSVLRELATHPDKEEIIDQAPNLTKREAHIEMRKLKGAEEGQQREEEENDWRKNNRRWFRELYKHALEVSRMVEMAVNSTPEKQRELLQVVEPLLLMNMGGCARNLVRFVDHFEALLEEEEAGAKHVEAQVERTHPEVVVQTAVQ